MAQETKFTPGPWVSFYKRKYDEWHVSMPAEGSFMKAGLCPDGIESPNREADAHLIAAAPDMYEALEAAAEEAESVFVALGFPPEISSLKVKIEAALSKARGEQ